MPKISNKKKKFVKKNFKQLSLEGLVREIGLKPKVIRSVVNEYSAEMIEREQTFSKKFFDDESLSTKQLMQIIGIGIIIILLTCLVYAPVLQNDFVWDDVVYVTENTLIRSLSIYSLSEMLISFHASNWHPLTWLSLAIDYTFWGLDPLGYHLTNIILHGLNTLIVFFLAIKLTVKAKEDDEISLPSKMETSILTQSLIVAGVTALLFGLHPLHVESVAWVSERKDLLCALFVLLSILSYLSYTSSIGQNYRWILLTTCLLLFIFALMSKPMAVTLPVILLLLDIYPLKRISLYPSKTGKTLSVLMEKAPFFALSIASSIITIMAQHAGEAIRSLERFPTDARLFNALRALVFYLGKTVFPVNLVPFYPFPINIHWLNLQYLLSALLVLLITGYCLWMVKQGKCFFFITWSYYVVTLLPVLGIVQVGGQAAADRYTYLPSLSIFLSIGVGMLWFFEGVTLTRSKSLFGGLVLVFIFIFMGQLTINQIKIWQNSEVFWSYVISSFPFPQSDPLAHYNLGNAYASKGRLDQAISEYKRALILKPHYAEAHNNLASAYVLKGKWDKAISEIKQSLAINPNYAMAHNNLGSIYHKKGDLDKAISEYKQAIAIKPDYAKAHGNIGLIYYSKGMFDEAIFEYEKALAINPNLSEIHYNLGAAYYYKGNYKLAIVHCDKAAELGGSVNTRLLELLAPYR